MSAEKKVKVKRRMYLSRDKTNQWRTLHFKKPKPLAEEEPEFPPGFINLPPNCPASKFMRRLMKKVPPGECIPVNVTVEEV